MIMISQLHIFPACLVWWSSEAKTARLSDSDYFVYSYIDCKVNVSQICQVITLQKLKDKCIYVNTCFVLLHATVSNALRSYLFLTLIHHDISD